MGEGFIGDTHSTLDAILAVLKKGDVVTHSYRGGRGGILDANGRVLPAVHSAIARSVHLDVGHGAGSFSFEVAEKALKQDLLPGTISSDVHQFNVNGPVFDLVTTLSKFLHMGLTLEQVIERATAGRGNCQTRRPRDRALADCTHGRGPSQSDVFHRHHVGRE